MPSRKRSNLDLNQVRVFVEVVRAGSFAQAGRRLGSPANSVSRHIQQLEGDVGVRLIHRSTRKLTLTAAGRSFFDRCAPSVAELQEAGERSLAESQAAAGLVRVAAPADFLDLFTLDTLALFLRTYPQVRVEFVLDDAKADLVAESIDVAIRAAHLVEGSLPRQKLLETEFRLVASRRYLDSRGTPADLEALAKHDCLPQSRRTGSMVWRLRDGQRSHEVRVSGRFKANTARAVLQAATAGLGIALLPEPIITRELASGRLVRVLPEYYRDGADLYAVWPSRRHMPRAVAAFIEFVAARVIS
jgi:DNA-binding transcriptional LysR family regulator